MQKTVIQQLNNLIITCFIALLCGWGLYQLHFPAPYLLGSLFGVWVAGGWVKPLRNRVGIPRWFVKPILLGLGVSMGAMFTPEVASSVFKWWPTVISMIAATVFATATGFWYLVGFRQYDRLLAILCCMPGGQSEVIAMSAELVEKDYVVALSHLIRVSVVFLLTPLLLTLVQGHDAVIESNRALERIPGVLDIGVKNVLLFFLVAVLGYGIAKAIRLPMPHLLGSLLFSIALHASGLISIPRIGEFLILAQIVIGGAIGARLSQVPFKTLARYLLDTLVSSLLVISVYLFMAAAISSVTGLSLLNLILSFIPGGFYEVTLLALLFGFDVAFVTFHHVIRILMIFFSLPAMVAMTRSSDENKS